MRPICDHKSPRSSQRSTRSDNVRLLIGLGEATAQSGENGTLERIVAVGASSSEALSE